MKKIYIAGFSVFNKRAKEIGKELKKVCDEAGYIGLYPLDNEVNDVNSIFKGNIDMIESCDILIADLNNFRGNDMDSGTAFELGYAYARGKVIYGFVDNIDATLTDKLGKVDSNGFVVENFGLPVNLMIGMSVKLIQGDFKKCLTLCHAQLNIAKFEAKYPDYKRC